jgi:hypothetical protein
MHWGEPIERPQQNGWSGRAVCHVHFRAIAVRDGRLHAPPFAARDDKRSGAWQSVRAVRQGVLADSAIPVNFSRHFEAIKRDGLRRGNGRADTSS